MEAKDLDLMCDRLERAKTSLMFAIQLYDSSSTRAEHMLIHARIGQVSQQILQLPSSLCDNPANIGHTDQSDSESSSSIISVRGPPKRSEASSWTWRCSFRLWPLSQAWCISVQRLSGGWNLHMSAVNLVSPDAEIFRRCAFGDLDGVRALFEAGLASPLDVACVDSENSITGLTVNCICSVLGEQLADRLVGCCAVE